MQMQMVWNTLESWLAENAPHLKQALKPGVQEDEVERLEKRIGVKLPEDFVAFYKIHNGQDAESEGIIDAEELLSFERIMEEWKVWKDLADTETFEAAAQAPELKKVLHFKSSLYCIW